MRRIKKRTFFVYSILLFQNWISKPNTDEYVAYALVVDGSAFSLDDKLHATWHQDVQVGEVVGGEAAPNGKSNYGKSHFVLLVSA